MSITTEITKACFIPFQSHGAILGTSALPCALPNGGFRANYATDSYLQCISDLLASTFLPLDMVPRPDQSVQATYCGLHVNSLTSGFIHSLSHL